MNTSLIILLACFGGSEIYERPAPLFLGEVVERQPLAQLLITHAGTGPDLGAYEWIFGPEPVRPGDLTLDGAIDRYDHLILANWCLTGPDVAVTTQLRRTADDTEIPAACWLADLDEDWDVDLRDYAHLQRMELAD